MTAEPDEGRLSYSTERLGALSDGVFAIVLTLLVLELKIPEGDNERELIADLQRQIPHLVAWLVSFLLVARFWMIHHAVIANLARCHSGTLTWNFIVLGLMSLVPFAASLVGDYAFDSVAVLVFAGLVGLAGLSIGLLARHAAMEKHLHREQQVVDLQWHWKYHARILPAIALTSILLLAVEEMAALAIWGIEPVIALFGARSRL